MSSDQSKSSGLSCRRHELGPWGGECPRLLAPSGARGKAALGWVFRCVGNTGLILDGARTDLATALLARPAAIMEHVARTMPTIWAGDPADPGRPRADDPAVRAAIVDLAGMSQSAVDLGGVMTLNLHLQSSGTVFRVHQRFVSRERVLAQRELRRELLRRQLAVPEPLPIDGRELFRCRGRWAELETFVLHERQPAGWDSYVWLFGAMGQLHRSLRLIEIPLPRPAVSTFGPPGSLRRWLSVTAGAAAAHEKAAAAAQRTNWLVGQLGEQWVPGRELPNHIVHGDIRLVNVGQDENGTIVYFDFGFAARRPRVHDLAYALFWMVLRPDDSGTAEEFPWNRLSELISVYEDEAKSRLEPKEREALFPYLAAVPLYLASISGFTPDPLGHLLEHGSSLDIAEWILSNRPAFA